MFLKNKKYSFTLVELMIVLAILAFLAGIVIFVVKPGTILDEFNDQKRLSEVKSIAKAIDYLNTISLGNLNLGVSTNVYLSLPDNTSTTCSSYSLPTLPTGFAYQCKNSTDYRKNDGNGWIPISFKETDSSNLLSTLPIDPTNDIYYYYSYNPGGSYEINAFFKTTKYINNYGSLDGGDSMNAIEFGSNLFDMPTTFPHNWIKVPGNPTYGTSDFWVMQYEAKYSITGHGASDAVTGCKTNSNYDVYDWARNCTYTANSTSNVISSPMGSPLTGISHTDAKVICTVLGSHLITNQEWMTIARNVDQQAPNWTSGVVGTGYLFNGNSGNTSKGYKAFADRYDADKGLNRNVRAFHVLSNGNRIYDLSGNVYEHVMVDNNDTLLNNLPNDGGASGWRNIELTALTTDGDLSSYNDLKPTNSSWNTNQGMGYLYTNVDIQTNRVLLRGSGFTSGSNGGIYWAIFNWDTDDNTYDGLGGFRCVKN